MFPDAATVEIVFVNERVTCVTLQPMLCGYCAVVVTAVIHCPSVLHILEFQIWQFHPLFYKLSRYLVLLFQVGDTIGCALHILMPCSSSLLLLVGLFHSNLKNESSSAHSSHYPSAAPTQSLHRWDRRSNSQERQMTLLQAVQIVMQSRLLQTKRGHLLHCLANVLSLPLVLLFLRMA